MISVSFRACCTCELTLLLVSTFFCQVANLEDIISERGACGVGFIANLENKASYDIIKDALTALGCMEHRGGCGADNDSGDGAGLMTSIPWDLFDNWANKQGIASFDKLHTGVGMVFLPKDDDLTKEAKSGTSLKLLAQFTYFIYEFLFICYVLIYYRTYEVPLENRNCERYVSIRSSFLFDRNIVSTSSL